MRINHTKCPVCSSSSIRQIAHCKNLPATLFPVNYNLKDGVETRHLIVFGCNKCSHMFSNYVDIGFNKRIYERYYHLYTQDNLESMHAIYREPFEKVFDLFYKGGECLLEIGCDNEIQLQKFIDLGLDCTAIAPVISDFNSVEFVYGFYEDGITGNFDYIIARFVLEHSLFIDKFFTQIYHNLKNSGLAFIQVPNEEFFLKSNILNIFAHEHANYFCRHSLEYAIERYGFKILYLSDSTLPHLICVFAKDEILYDFNRYLQINDFLLGQVLYFIQANYNKKVILYGSGLTLTKLLYNDISGVDGFENIELVDDNTLIHGRYMPNTNLQIKHIAECDNKNSVVLLLMNPIYYPKVIDKLKHFEDNVFGIINNRVCRVYGE
jgi:hypothetical protein